MAVARNLRPSLHCLGHETASPRYCTHGTLAQPVSTKLTDILRDFLDDIAPTVFLRETVHTHYKLNGAVSKEVK
jgi:hypothetical protein